MALSHGVRVASFQLEMGASHMPTSHYHHYSAGQWKEMLGQNCVWMEGGLYWHMTLKLCYCTVLSKWWNAPQDVM